MKLTFVWDGDPINPEVKQNVESSISYGINSNDEFKDLKPANIYLSNDILKSVISGVITDNNDKSLFTVTVYPYEQNKTIYEMIEDQK